MTDAEVGRLRSSRGTRPPQRFRASRPDGVLVPQPRDWRRAGLDRIELGFQGRGASGVKSGADAADIGQLPVFCRRQEQTSQSAIAAARLVADDDELVALDAFGLHPFLAPARAVGAVEPLRDNTFQTKRAGLLQKVTGISLDRFAEDDALRVRTAQEVNVAFRGAQSAAGREDPRRSASEDRIRRT